MIFLSQSRRFELVRVGLLALTATVALSANPAQAGLPTSYKDIFAKSKAPSKRVAEASLGLRSVLEHQNAEQELRLKNGLRRNESRLARPSAEAREMLTAVDRAFEKDYQTAINLPYGPDANLSKVYYNVEKPTILREALIERYFLVTQTIAAVEKEMSSKGYSKPGELTAPGAPAPEGLESLVAQHRALNDLLGEVKEEYARNMDAYAANIDYYLPLTRHIGFRLSEGLEVVKKGQGKFEGELEERRFRNIVHFLPYVGFADSDVRDAVAASDRYFAARWEQIGAIRDASVTVTLEKAMAFPKLEKVYELLKDGSLEDVNPRAADASPISRDKVIEVKSDRQVDYALAKFRADAERAVSFSLLWSTWLDPRYWAHLGAAKNVPLFGLLKVGPLKRVFDMSVRQHELAARKRLWWYDLASLELELASKSPYTVAKEVLSLEKVSSEEQVADLTYVDYLARVPLDKTWAKFEQAVLKPEESGMSAAEIELAKREFADPALQAKVRELSEARNQAKFRRIDPNQSPSWYTMARFWAVSVTAVASTPYIIDGANHLVQHSPFLQKVLSFWPF